MPKANTGLTPKASNERWWLSSGIQEFGHGFSKVQHLIAKSTRTLGSTTGTAQGGRDILDELHGTAASCPLELKIGGRIGKLAFMTCIIEG